MPASQHLHFSTHIAAPVERVWRTMLDPQSYRDWTAAFCEGSYYEGSWDPGAEIRFLAPNGDGMVATIAEHRPREFVSIRHLGHIVGGREDRDSEAVRAWAPAYENYTFKPAGDGTELLVDQDASDEFAQYLQDAWPKALERLKALCEAPGEAR